MAVVMQLILPGPEESYIVSRFLIIDCYLEAGFVQDSQYSQY